MHLGNENKKLEENNTVRTNNEEKNKNQIEEIIIKLLKGEIKEESDKMHRFEKKVLKQEKEVKDERFIGD